MPKNWKLLRYEPTSFAGINEENAKSSLIVFLEDNPIIGLKGDQATNKSSNLLCLQRLLGGLIPPNAINSKDNAVKATAQFQLEDGRLLDVSCDKNNFKVYVTQELNGKPMRSMVPSPQDFIKNLIGPLGVSPMFLKAMDGDKQVAWIRNMANLTPDQIKLEKDIVDKYNADFKQRTNVNREVKRLAAELSSALYVDYNAEHKAFEENSNYRKVMEEDKKGAGNIELAQKSWDKANEDATKLAKCKSTKEALEAQKVRDAEAIDRKKKEIERLQKELESQEAAMSELDGRIATGEKMINDLEGADKRAEDARNVLLNLGQFVARKDAANKDVEKANSHTGLSMQSTVLSAKLEEWLDAKKKFVQAITPEVEGLEVRIASEMDVEFEAQAYKEINTSATDKEVNAHVLNLQVQNKTGIFYNDRSVAELCESELWDLCLVLWRNMGVNVVFIENLSDLGTDAIEQVNKFAENGMVFFSQMERGQKDLQITFQTKIPVVKAAEA